VLGPGARSCTCSAYQRSARSLRRERAADLL